MPGAYSAKVDTGFVNGYAQIAGWSIFLRLAGKRSTGFSGDISPM
jgi:hypothetical protein